MTTKIWRRVPVPADGRAGCRFSSWGQTSHLLFGSWHRVRRLGPSASSCRSRSRTSALFFRQIRGLTRASTTRATFRPPYKLCSARTPSRGLPVHEGLPDAHTAPLERRSTRGRAGYRRERRVPREPTTATAATMATATTAAQTPDATVAISSEPPNTRARHRTNRSRSGVTVLVSHAQAGSGGVPAGDEEGRLSMLWTRRFRARPSAGAIAARRPIPAVWQC
jgi:hypothetical protein